MRNRITRAVFVLALLPAWAGAAGTAIPAAFQGNWATEPARCAEEFSDALMRIHAREFGGYEYGCDMRRVDTASATTLKGKAACSSSGGPKEVMGVHWTLLDNGARLQVDGGEKLVRCKR